tara:strand:- start:8438 stop:9271 length:834 start_codon:yes stop_codon:yes gene_type:complete
MTLPTIDYPPGAHGNFLIKCLNVASGLVEDREFYGKDRVGAHATDFPEIIVQNATKVTDQIHKEKRAWLFITLDKEDLYKYQWHYLYASNDFGFNVLKYLPDQAHQFYSNDLLIAESVREQFKHFDIHNIDSCREMYKLSFGQHSGHLTRMDHVLQEYSHDFRLPFKTFYNKKDFLNCIPKLLHHLGYTQKQDIEHQFDNFIKKKQSIIHSEQRVLRAFACYKDKTPMDISDFALYEQAYLDYLIEKYLGNTRLIVYNSGYPKNTIDIEHRLETEYV